MNSNQPIIRGRAAARINLGQRNSVFFEHHVLPWKDDHTPMSVMPLQGGVKRASAGTPFIISVAHGPGRIAFSRDATGELVVLPLHPGMELGVGDVRGFTWVTIMTGGLGCSKVKNESSRNKAPLDAPLDFCDLVRKPEDYDSKTVRVRSVFIGFHELA